MSGMDNNTNSTSLAKKQNKKNIIQYKLNPSTQLLNEDSLRSIVCKKEGKNWNKLRLRCSAPNKQSPFGNFPSDFLPQKNNELIMMEKEKHKDTIINEQHRKIQENALKTTAFSSLVRTTKDKPSKSGALKPRFITASSFRLHYDRGDLPIQVEHDKGARIKWKDESFEDFNYKIFLPIFIDGIREKTDPYRFLAVQGSFDLLDRVKDAVIKVIPDLIPPLKTALNTRDPEIIAIALKVIQKLVLSSDLAGDVLVPFYRQLLPIFNMYKNKNQNLGDKFEYSQRKKLNLGDLIQETLEIMEMNGGDVSGYSENNNIIIINIFLFFIFYRMPLLILSI